MTPSHNLQLFIKGERHFRLIFTDCVKQSIQFYFDVIIKGTNSVIIHDVIEKGILHYELLNCILYYDKCTTLPADLR